MISALFISLNSFAICSIFSALLIWIFTKGSAIGTGKRLLMLLLGSIGVLLGVIVLGVLEYKINFMEYLTMCRGDQCMADGIFMMAGYALGTFCAFVKILWCAFTKSSEYFLLSLKFNLKLMAAVTSILVVLG